MLIRKVTPTSNWIGRITDVKLNPEKNVVTEENPKMEEKVEEKQEVTLSGKPESKPGNEENEGKTLEDADKKSNTDVKLDWNDLEKNVVTEETPKMEEKDEEKQGAT
ncbi:Uncharacterized protein Fot_10549 [Forsythia ovata]|uniref:Uncharacterized protein n=1 Tax=Forsythia ovata TaxID=205694 RepID=A0ABD1WH65_9LAMI